MKTCEAFITPSWLLKTCYHCLSYRAIRYYLVALSSTSIGQLIVTFLLFFFSLRFLIQCCFRVHNGLLFLRSEICSDSCLRCFQVLLFLHINSDFHIIQTRQVVWLPQDTLYSFSARDGEDYCLWCVCVCVCIRLVVLLGRRVRQQGLAASRPKLSYGTPNLGESDSYFSSLLDINSTLVLIFGWL